MASQEIIQSGERRPSPHNAILEGKLDNVKWLVDALSCIYSTAHKGQEVTITVHSEGGLRFSVEQTGVLQASVIVPATAFSLFRARDDSLRLRLNLSLMMECLSLFATGYGIPVSTHIWYADEGSPLYLRLWDGDADTVCELTTLSFDEEDLTLPVDLGFYGCEIISNVVIDSIALRDAFTELDYCNATTGEIRISPTEPRFMLSSPAASVSSHLDGLGEEALCTIEMPDPMDRNVETFQSFQCKQTQCSVYKLQHLQRCKQGLGLSETCKLQMNADGMLSVVCKMKSLDADRNRGSGLERCFVEFVIVAQEIDEEEEDGDLQDERQAENELRRGDEDEDADEDEIAGTPPQ